MAIDIKALARLGAAARLRELNTERAAILKAFPALRGDRPTVTRKRRMSAAGKAAVGAAAKRRWAEWRKRQSSEQ